MIENYLAIEAPLVAHVRETLPQLRSVFGMADLDKLKDKAAQFAPCACVVYDGDTVPNTEAARGGQGQAQLVYQRWVVWLIVRNVRDGGDGGGARADAGPLLSLLIAALAGWTPLPGFRPFRRGTAPRPLFEDGVIHFPVLFEAPLITV